MTHSHINKNLAQRIGLNGMLVMQSLSKSLNMTSDLCEWFEGALWITQTDEQLKERFPFWSSRTIYRTFKMLIEKNILLKCSVKSPRRRFYAIHNAYDPEDFSFTHQDFHSHRKSCHVDNSLSGQAPHFSKNNLAGDFYVNSSTQKNEGYEKSLNSPKCPYCKRVLRCQSSCENSLLTNCILHSSCQNSTSYLNILSPLPPHLEKKGGGKKNPKIKQQEQRSGILRKSEGTLSCQSDVSFLKNHFFKNMVDLWNQTVQKYIEQAASNVTLTPQRQEKLTEVLSLFNGDLEEWNAYCHRIQKTQFLMGASPSGFRVNFDWAIEPSNIRKILEGSIYDRPAYNAQNENNQKGQIVTLLDKKSVSLQDHKLLEEHCSQFPEAWGTICKELVTVLGMNVFKNWFYHFSPLCLETKEVRLRCSSAFCKDYILEKFASPLEKALKKVLPQMERFTIEILPEGSLEESSSGQGP